jgi:hypothetical protein
MAGTRRARDAGDAFYSTISGVLHCVTGDGLLIAPGTSPTRGRSRLLTFQTERARLRDHRGNRLFLAVEHEYAVETGDPDGPRVTTLSYIYTIYDGQERRLLGYHYHPQGRGEARVPFPHLHVYEDISVAGRPLQKLHLPTGRVALEDVVLLLIEGFEVVPPPAYARREPGGEERWRRVLREAREMFVRLRRWA